MLMNVLYKAGTEQEKEQEDCRNAYLLEKKSLINKTPFHEYLASIWNSFEQHKRKMILESFFKMLHSLHIPALHMLSASPFQRLLSFNRQIQPSTKSLS